VVKAERWRPINRAPGHRAEGEPFIRYLEVCRDGQPLRFELGAPTAVEPDAGGPVHAGKLPPGRYATFLHGRAL
jgi:hypothetical protein